MKALKFTKIDYIKTKVQMLVFPLMLLVIALIMLSPDSDISNYNATVPFCYMIFMMTIFATTPFGSYRGEEKGFLLLLPGTTWDRVAGRFLYGASLIFIAVVLGIGAVIIYKMIGLEVSALDMPLCLIGLAVGILIIAIEYIFFYMVGENQGQNYLGVVRVIPGMGFFFVTANLSKSIRTDPDGVARLLQAVGNRLNMIAWGSVIAALVIFIASIVVCVMVTDKRDC